MNLTRFFKNPFLDKEISIGELRNFAEHHMKALSTNNPGGIYSTILALVTSKYIAYFGTISDSDVEEGVRQALTKSVDNIIRDFKAAVSQHSGAVYSKFGKDAPQVQEFFPKGLTEYSNMTKEQAPVFFKRIAEAFTKYEPELGNDLAKLFNDFRSSYDITRGDQVTQKAEVTEKSAQRQVDKESLADQLFSNLLTIANNNRNKPEALNDYFDQQLIKEDVSSEEDETPNP